MLTAGGLLDQPAGLWFAVQYAGSVKAMLERISEQGFRFDSLSASDRNLYDAITKARMELLN